LTALLRSGGGSASSSPFVLHRRLRPSAERRTIGATLACLAAATTSWDILGVDIIGRTVKLTLVLALASIAAWVVQLAMGGRTLPVRLGPRGLGVASVAAASVVLLVIRAGLAPLAVTAPAVVALVLPAVVFPLAVVLHRRWVTDITNGFIGGMAVTSAVGIYEWVAQLVGLPKLTAYAARIGTLPRSAGLSFEPAYYASAAFVAAVLCYFLWRPTTLRTVSLVLLGGGLVAANARAVVIQALVSLVAYRLLASRNPVALVAHRRVLRWGLVAGLAVSCVMLLAPQLTSGLTARIQSFTDANEAESNAVRLQLYGQVVDIVADEPLLGVGPGMLASEYEARGFQGGGAVTADGRYEVVANNLVLQAMADGGIGVLLLQLSLVVAALWCAFSARVPALGAAWCGLVVGAGMTVSNFWDAEPWLLLGLLVAVDANRTWRRGLRAVQRTSSAST
jgi:hypothetical protein